MTINKQAVFTVFDDADSESASFAERLIKLGIGDKATAKPLAMEWASKKYKARITKGQRGYMLPRNSDAERAMYRVLDVCFPKADAPKNKPVNNKTDAVASLAKKYAALTGAEKRRFMSLIGK